MYRIQVKSQKGITLATLVVYMVIFTIIIGVMTTISTFFYGNIGDAIDTPKYVSEFNKFVMFFVVDIKNYNEAIVTDTTIEFENGPIYSYRNNMIYRNDVVIANYVMECKFTPKQYDVSNITKNLINVNMKIGKEAEETITRNIDFTLKYW